MTQRPIIDLRVRLAAALSLFAGVLALGTFGYMIVEGWSFLDALFMTVTTVTTVGFREVRPLDTSGRILTIVLVLFGVGTAFYLLTALVSVVIEGDLRNVLGVTRMKSRIEQLRGHHVLCGYGRVGEEIAREFRERKMPFVIVDNNPAVLEKAIQGGCLVVEGDATSDETLTEAGVQRAATLLAAADSDAGNTYITLTAKALNPNIVVVARAGTRESESRLLRAGADRVISPYSISGRRMALSAIQPNIVDFFDTLSGGRNDRILAEIDVSTDSGLFGLYVRHVMESSSVTILGLQKADGELIVGPRSDVRLEDGDRLVVVGREEEVARITTPVRSPADGGAQAEVQR